MTPAEAKAKLIEMIHEKMDDLLDDRGNDCDCPMCKMHRKPLYGLVDYVKGLPE